MDIKVIERNRVAGEITLVLKQGTDAERRSLLGVIERLCGIGERARLENWVNDGMPGRESRNNLS